MRAIPPDSPLAVGDVLHQAAFGFATVVAVDPTGASLRWETPGALHPAWVSRAALRDAYHICAGTGLLALTVRDLDRARRLVLADDVGAVGRLLGDVGPAHANDLREWFATRRVILRDEFPTWWAALADRLATDSRFRLEGDRWSVVDGATFPDPALSAPERLAAPGTVPAGEALELACDLARAVCGLHGAGQTLPAGTDASRRAFTRVGLALVAEGQLGGERTADVAVVARLVLEQVLGPLPDERLIPTPEILPCLGELAPELPLDLLGVLERAISPDPGLRHRDAFALLHELELARATHRIREDFPAQVDAQVAVGFDSHIGISRAIGGQVNQDALLVAGDPECALLVVADGISISSAGSGDLASRILTESLRKWWTEQAGTLRTASPARVHQAIREGLTRANRHILTEAARMVQGRLAEHIPMGSTVVLAVTQGNRVHLASLGDSRAWLVGATGASLLTSDQNLQSQLLREHVSGTEPDWTEERFALTGYCGHLDAAARPALPPVYTRSFTLLPGEWVVMATDGYSDFAHEENAGLARQLVATVSGATGATPGLRAMAIARRVVQAANEGGGGDNVTVLAFTLSPGPMGPSVGRGVPLTDGVTTAG